MQKTEEKSSVFNSGNSPVLSQHWTQEPEAADFSTVFRGGRNWQKKVH